MSTGKYLSVSLLVIGAIFLFLAKHPIVPTPSTQLTDTPPPALSYEKYRAPERVPTAIRPEITIDEDQHPRWVKSLEQSSLRGTEVDRVSLTPQADGSLDLKPGILLYFDYFLSLQGEMAEQRILQLLYDDIFANFPHHTATQLYDVLNRYLQYSKAMDAYLADLSYTQVQAQGLTKQNIEQRFQSQYFSSKEIDKLFTGYTKMLDVPSQGREESKKLEQYANTPKASRLAVATELFGAETALRLQALEKQKEIWQQRLQSYHEKKLQLSYAPLDRASQKAAIDDLRKRLFSPSEQVRVRTWEQHMQATNTD